MKFYKRLVSNQKYVDCYSSEVCSGYIERVCNEMADKFAGEEDVSGGFLDASSYIFLEINGDSLYDILIADKDASVVGEKVTARKERVISFPQYDVEIKIILTIRCDLQPEDMALFESMGKVETEYHQATVSKSVFCEIQSNTIPF